VTRLILALVSICLPQFLMAQSGIRSTYHDAAKKYVKEVYQVKDTIQNVLHGRYISYFLNGSIESKGQFMNNETTGVWEFFYETGNLKMRGILRQNSNFGLWEYYYEGGQKSMEGTINGKFKEGEWKIFYESGVVKEIGKYVTNKREGIWKSYFEDGALRGEIEYKDDHGRHTEYYHSGKVLAEGPKSGTKNVGRWRYYVEEDGTLQSEGDFSDGKKNGEWKFYYPSGKIGSSGFYENDESTGKWIYYFEDGTISSEGEYVGGKKNGYWNAMNKTGSRKSEITYANGSGEYREFYSDGKLKVKGQIIDGKNQGKWEYFFQDGKKEGECEFDKGKGTYYGFYPSGTLQTKGQIEDDLRVGTWEIYEEDGKLSGYYKPFYDGTTLVGEINSLINAPKKNPLPTASMAARRKGFYYFQSRFPEYHGVIIEGNPAMGFIGSMPFGIEFYNEGRLGHEFEFEGIRNPFFVADAQVAQDKLFRRGYAISFRQKFYNTMKTGMWYFAHELRFTNTGYFSNVAFPQLPTAVITASASEQKAQYGVLLGIRLMQQNDGDGFTLDSYVGYGIGYRKFDVDPMYEGVFENVNKNGLSQTFRFGLNIGYAFSFDGRRR
jgi:antitoxin component YwqK of YwqJK toxin-antitoxin module